MEYAYYLLILWIAFFYNVGLLIAILSIERLFEMPTWYWFCFCFETILNPVYLQLFCCKIVGIND